MWGLFCFVLGGRGRYVTFCFVSGFVFFLLFRCNLIALFCFCSVKCSMCVFVCSYVLGIILYFLSFCFVFFLTFLFLLFPQTH